MADLEYTVEDGIGTILLNRPETKNAFTFAMIDEWAAALRSARTDPEVRVVVVTGAGNAFCSGVDLGEFTGDATDPLAVKSTLHDRIHRVAYALEDLDKPVIAAVSGVAVGAGMDMALMCDIRLLARSARLSEGYIKVGLVPGDGGCYFLPRLIGMAKALELLWTGDFIDAEEALRLGLASYVYEDADFAASARVRQPYRRAAADQRAADQAGGLPVGPYGPAHGARPDLLAHGRSPQHARLGRGHGGVP